MVPHLCCYSRNPSLCPVQGEALGGGAWQLLSHRGAQMRPPACAAPSPPAPPPPASPPLQTLALAHVEFTQTSQGANLFCHQLCCDLGHLSTWHGASVSCKMGGGGVIPTWQVAMTQVLLQQVMMQTVFSQYWALSSIHWLIDRVAKLSSHVGGLAALGPPDPPPHPPHPPAPSQLGLEPSFPEVCSKPGKSLWFSRNAGLPTSSRPSVTPRARGTPLPARGTVMRKAQGPGGEGREQGNIWKFLILEISLANTITPPPSHSDSPEKGPGRAGGGLLIAGVSQ